MATFGTIAGQVADDLARTNLGPQIRAAINEAIHEYDATRYWFNVKRDLTFNTVSGQDFYGVSDNPGIPNLTTIDALFVSNGTADKLQAKWMDSDDMEWLTPPTVSGRPTNYTYFDSQIRLYPVPNAIFGIRVTGFYTLSDLAADGDTNVWTDNAANLLRLSARRRVQHNIIRAYDDAQVTKMAEDAANEVLLTRTVMMRQAGQIVPTQF